MGHATITFIAPGGEPESLGSRPTLEEAKARAEEYAREDLGVDDPRWERLSEVTHGLVGAPLVVSFVPTEGDQS